jgi:signal transduction histidine kinase
MRMDDESHGDLEREVAMLVWGGARLSGRLGNRVTALRRAAHGARVRVAVADTAESLPDYVELAAYFIVSDALGSISDDAHASHASVAATRRMGRLTVEVKDDGGADRARAGRLRRLMDRLAAIEGRLEIESSERGTTVRASIPCAL